MRGDVGRRGVDDLAEITKRQPVGEWAGVVDIERGPGTVPGLHAQAPLHTSLDGGGDAVGLGMGNAFEGEDHLSGVVDVRIVVVVKFERPAAGRQSGAAYCPVTAP